MLHRVSVGGVLRIATAALFLSLAVSPAAFAKGNDNGPRKNDDKHSIPDCSRHDDDHDGPGRAHEDPLFCPNKQVVVRIDEKTCPEKPGQPVVIRKRVCCLHGDTTSCRPFRPCPPRSRS